MSIYISLNKPQKNILLELINRSNGSDYTLSDLDFSEITTLSQEEQQHFKRNTRVKLTGKGRLRGVNYIYYDRVELSELLPPDGEIEADFILTNTHEDLSKINAILGIQLTHDEVLLDHSEDGHYTLVINASLIYTLNRTYRIVPESYFQTETFIRDMELLWNFTTANLHSGNVTSVNTEGS